MSSYIEPFISNAFVVYFHGLLPTPVDMSFQSISGLTAEITTEQYQIGGLTSDAVNLPIGTNFSDLTLKRGLKPLPSALSKWCESAFNDFQFQPLDVFISLIGKDSLPVKNWQIVGAIPVKLEYGELNAMESQVFLETFTLRYLSFNTVN